MDIKELKEPIEGLCKAVVLACEKAGGDSTGLDLFTRGEIWAYVMYLTMENGEYDSEARDKIEEAISHHVGYNQIELLIRETHFESRDRYLLRAPQTIQLMVEMDNQLYDIGEEFNCFDEIFSVYKLVGEFFVNEKGCTDDKRAERYGAFLRTMEAYRIKESRVPRKNVTLGRNEEDINTERDKAMPEPEIVKPSKKGVPAPKKS